MHKDLQSKGKLMGVNEIGSRRVVVKLILSLKLRLQNCGSYIGTGDGCPMHVSTKYLCGLRPHVVHGLQVQWQNIRWVVAGARKWSYV